MCNFFFKSENINDSVRKYYKLIEVTIWLAAGQIVKKY